MKLHSQQSHTHIHVHCFNCQLACPCEIANYSVTTYRRYTTAANYYNSIITKWQFNTNKSELINTGSIVHTCPVSTTFSTDLATCFAASTSCSWHSGFENVGATTLVQATSWEAARAHCVAEPITAFLSAWLSHLFETSFAFSTSVAVALATAFASAIRESWTYPQTSSRQSSVPYTTAKQNTQSWHGLKK